MSLASTCANKSTGLPLAAGVSLKPEYFAEVLELSPPVGFFEIHAENYFVAGGPMHHYLERICARYPLSIHGVGLSIGGAEPPDAQHLRQLRELLMRYRPAVFSEHLAWSSHGGTFFNDLLPLPYNRHTLARVCEHIERVQEALGLRILLENPSTYVEFSHSTYSEAEFLTETVRRSGCGLLLDVNNAYISSCNHNRDLRRFLLDLPLDAVGEIHLAGFHRDSDSLGAPLLIDSHDSAVDQVVWKAYGELLEHSGPRPTLIEWDNDIPPLETLCAEAQKAQGYLSVEA